MAWRGNDGAAAARRLGRALGRFARAQDGVLMVFGLFVLLVMMMTAGLAVDTIRHERERARLQATLDRAVLAAADIQHSLSPREVVADHFARAGLADALDENGIVVEQRRNHRSVSGSAARDMPTLLLQLAGVDSLTTATTARAEEGAEVEISLVLDVSDSMEWDGTDRMANMQAAAIQFVRTMMPEAGRPGESSLTSISLVPYASSVNVGADLIEYYNLDRVHDRAHCVIFDDRDYDDVALSRTRPLTQYEHFDPKDEGTDWNRRPPEIEEPRCPSTVNRMIPLATDPGALIPAIRALETTGSTAMDIGMRWGIAMLDPDTRPVIDGLIRQDGIDTTASGRPLRYDTPGAIKIAVLMTDGNPEEPYDLHPRLKARETPEAWSNVWYDTQTGQHSLLLRGSELYDFPYERAADVRRAEDEAEKKRKEENPSAPAVPRDPCNDVWEPGEREGPPRNSSHGLPRGIVRLAPIEENRPVRRNDEDCEPRWYWVGESGTHDHPEWWGGDPAEQHATHESRQRWRDPRNGVVRLTHREVYERFSTEDADDRMYGGAYDRDWLSRDEYRILREPPEWRGRLGTGSWRRLGSEEDTVDRLLRLCTAAKDRGVHIFTIAFELDEIRSSETRGRARRLMSGCATSPEYYFDAEGVEISEAFATVASQIGQLRLTR